MFEVPVLMFAHLVVGVQAGYDVNCNHNVVVVADACGVVHWAEHVAGVVVHDVAKDAHCSVNVVPRGHDVVVVHGYDIQHAVSGVVQQEWHVVEVSSV